MVKTAVKKATAAIASGDPEAARAAVRHAMSVLDRAAQKGVLHPNNAARRKSRLILKFNAAVAALQAPAEEAPKKPRAARAPASRSERRPKK
jgi:ribosomal protein S20